MEDAKEGGADLPGSTPEHGSPRAQRLRELARLAGSARSLAERASVPYGTLQNYLGGGELKLSNAIALAEATGVRLEWLATGVGPMREGDAAPAAAPPPPAAPPRLFSLINADRLGAAYAAALQALAARGQHDADPVRIMQITTIIYDSLAEVEEKQMLAGHPPQPGPQNNPLEPAATGPKRR